MAFEFREIIDTIQMTEIEHFDIRTVTLGISLRDCGSRSAATTCQKIYDKVCRVAEYHLAVAEACEQRFGVSIANKRISVTPIAIACDGLTRAEMVQVAQSLDRAAGEVGVDYLAGYSALVQKGMTNGDRALMEAIPEALATTKHICSSVNVGSTSAGLNIDAINMMSEVVLETARLTAERDSIGAAKLVVFCNAVEDNPFVAGAFHGVSEPEAVINVGISGPGVVLRTVRELSERASMDTLAESIKRTTFKITRAGDTMGRWCAEELAKKTSSPLEFGIVDLSLAPTPAEGDSIGDILMAMGLEHVGTPGTTAALALLNEAVKRGGLMAANHIGGLSGAFIPVSEDQAFIEAAAKGYITLEKLEAMTAICSVGLDMVAIPGDTSAQTIAGIFMDEFAIGMINNKTTAARLIPVQGKGIGDFAEFGGLLGRAPIMEVSKLNNDIFVGRGGRMPAPIRSLTN